MELRINQILQDKGMKLSDLADKMGVDQSNLKRSLEKNPSLSRLEEVAKALGVNVQDLFPYVPPVLTAGTVQVGDRYYTLIPTEVPEKPYSYDTGRFINRIMDFILQCLKNNDKTQTFCGLYEDKCPFALVFDHVSGRLIVSFCPATENTHTFWYDPRDKMNKSFFSEKTTAIHLAQSIMEGIQDLI